MKVGVFLTPWGEGGDGRDPSWQDVLHRAQLAAAIGADSIWVSDHLQMEPEPGVRLAGWEGWSQIAALAAVVPRVEIGALVMCALWRNPALMAKMADTVDEISGGRLILGLGAGWHEPEFRAYGYPFDHRIDRFSEALAVTVPLLREGAVDFAGEYVTARACELRPRGPRLAGPPVMIGALANRPRLLALTARYADIWNAWLSWQENTPAALAPALAAVDAACEAVGRDPATLQRSVAVQIDYPDAVPNRSPDARPLRGSPQQLADTLDGFAAVGIDHLQVVLNPNTSRSIERFAHALEHLRPPPSVATETSGGS
ncbi:MAG: LLM class flavin-dependent oxidoreductase [Thermomicrobiales bacterium]|nr:LLM class flavin-dependent oxidoreductase [Thermomicrobiales bacterium]